MTAFQDSPAVYLKLVDVSYGSTVGDEGLPLKPGHLTISKGYELHGFGSFEQAEALPFVQVTRKTTPGVRFQISVSRPLSHLHVGVRNYESPLRLSGVAALTLAHCGKAVPDSRYVLQRPMNFGGIVVPSTPPRLASVVCHCPATWH